MGRPRKPPGVPTNPELAAHRGGTVLRASGCWPAQRSQKGAGELQAKVRTAQTANHVHRATA